MSLIEHGQYGAKRQSWHEPNPRELLVRVIDENPGAKEPAVFKAFLKALKDNDDYWPAVAEYWFANNYRSLTNPRRRALQKRSSAQTAAKMRYVARIKQQILSLSLNQAMPDGRHLGDWKGTEGVRYGGSLAKAGKIAGTKTFRAAFADDKALAKALR